MIKYRIFQTKLRSKKQHVAKVNLLGCYNRKALVGLMLELGPSRRREELEAMLSLFEKAIIKACTAGFAINLERFLRFEPVIQGGFESGEDQFTRPRNQIQVRAIPNKGFQENFREILPEKLPMVTFSPVFHVVEDLATGQKNLTVSRKQAIRLRGERLRGLREEGRAHLWFVSVDQPEERTASLKPYSVTDTEILLILPPVKFSRGYFEMCWHRDLSNRFGRSEVLAVVD
ncbi:MAG: hypothetical protein HKM05_12025 [Spirochaetales bacterium]|nr:hypothetical protein [Spirochaetales bacterium]